MAVAFFLPLAKHTVPHMADAAHGFGQVGPRHFAVSKVAVDFLVPNQPTRGGRAIVVVTAEQDIPAPSGANQCDQFSVNWLIVPFGSVVV